MPEVETDGLGSLEILDEKISEVEIKAIIKKLSKRKSAGREGIGNEIMKKVEQSLTPLLAVLFNMMLQRGVYPDSWKKIILHPIFKKKGSPREVSNYRGVGLLTSFQKIFNKIIQQRLYRWSEENKIFPKCD